MNSNSNQFPTAIDLAEAQARGRRERSRAFYVALKSMGGWISGGRPQVRYHAPAGSMIAPRN